MSSGKVSENKTAQIFRFMLFPPMGEKNIKRLRRRLQDQSGRSIGESATTPEFYARMIF